MAPRNAELAADGKPAMLGCNAVGTAVRCGTVPDLFEEGDTVFYAESMIRDGSNAELQVVDERIVSYAPTSLSETDAAGLLLTLLT